jgi:hypothetical protein
MHDKTKMNHRSLGIVVLLLLGLWLSVSATSCNLVESARARLRPRTSTSVAVSATRIIALIQATATPVPISTPTSRPTLPMPTQPVAPNAGTRSDGLLVVPTQPNTPFTIDLTEAQVNAYLVGKTFDQQGLTLRDAQVVLTSSEVVATLQAKHLESGLSAGVTVRGVPVAANGNAYVRINDVNLDQSVNGFARLIAKGLIDAAIKQYSAPEGIPIPTQNVTVEDVRLASGKITIIGRTR